MLGFAMLFFVVICGLASTKGALPNTSVPHHAGFRRPSLVRQNAFRYPRHPPPQRLSDATGSDGEVSILTVDLFDDEQDSYHERVKEGMGRLARQYDLVIGGFDDARLAREREALKHLREEETEYGWLA